MKVIKRCQYCKKEFEVEDFDVRRGRGKYCSRDCWNSYRKGKIRPEIRKRIIKKCVVCGKEFETGGRAGRINKIFCSNECSFKARYRNGLKCNDIEPLDLAYIAGFLDGEGSIFIYKRREESYGMRISIAQSIKGQSIMDW